MSGPAWREELGLDAVNGTRGQIEQSSMQTAAGATRGHMLGLGGADGWVGAARSAWSSAGIKELRQGGHSKLVPMAAAARVHGAVAALFISFQSETKQSMPRRRWAFAAAGVRAARPRAKQRRQRHAVDELGAAVLGEENEAAARTNSRRRRSAALQRGLGGGVCRRGSSKANHGGFSAEKMKGEI